VGILPSNNAFVDLLSWNWGSFQTLDLTFASSFVRLGFGLYNILQYKCNFWHQNTMLTVALLAAAVSTGFAANDQAPLHLLGPAGYPNARCLDGSSSGLYFR
jgi:hypothetical protein